MHSNKQKKLSKQSNLLLNSKPPSGGFFLTKISHRYRSNGRACENTHRCTTIPTSYPSTQATQTSAGQLFSYGEAWTYLRPLRSIFNYSESSERHASLHYLNRRLIVSYKLSYSVN